MLSLLAKILAHALGRDPWRRSTEIVTEFPREPRAEVIDIEVRTPMSVLTRRVGARTATRRRIRFEKAHWQIPVPPAIRWDPLKGDFGAYVPR